MHKIEVIISYSKYDMDNWDERSETKFIIESDKKIVNDIWDIAAAYLKAVGIEYREFMVRTNSIT